MLLEASCESEPPGWARARSRRILEHSPSIPAPGPSFPSSERGGKAQGTGTGTGTGLREALQGAAASWSQTSQARWPDGRGAVNQPEREQGTREMGCACRKAAKSQSWE